MARTESTLCVIALTTLLIGVSLIVIGIVIRVDPDFTLFTKCLDLARYHVACYLAIISGILLFTLPFISCLGVALQKQYLFFLELIAARFGANFMRHQIPKFASSRSIAAYYCFHLLALSNPTFFWQYCLVSLITISLNIASCSLVWRITDREQFHNSLRLEIAEHIKNRYHSPLSYQFIGTLQSKLSCCGAESINDYASPNLSSCRLDFTSPPKGCASSLENYLQILSAIIGGLSIVSIILQLCCIFVWYSAGTVGYKIIES